MSENLLPTAGRLAAYRPAKLWKAAGIAAAITFIGIAHHWTDPMRIHWHVVYQDLCYVPILLAAYWFGMAGGVTAAVLAGAGSIVHFHGGWAANRPFLLSQYGQAVAFVITGVVGGVLASAERRARMRKEQALAALELAHNELRASHEQLQRADRLSGLGELAAGLAHEIGNPLGGVKGAVDIIAGRATQGSPEAEFSALAQRELARIKGLIEDFLAYARPHEPRRVPTEIFTIVDRVVSLLAGRAADRQVRLVVERGAVPPLLTDPEQLVQVFLNVVLNAIQATPPGSSVTLAVHAFGDAAAIDVRDEGPGIPASARQRIFSPFFSTKPGGTGLGLAISSRIVQAHGGRIDILQPDRGAVVRVILPLEVDVPALGTSQSQVQVV